ncbi:hypothetical protein HPP92_025775 [Vanilla planifolia]|uniref:RING-type domain-containing protein n=1 Tax=Vanilla planifolia TaxID=51239 RepID=A0A835PG00_VANPL|nr:hypothetical protein HPP92_025775 [Vanilla planifolia]
MELQGLSEARAVSGFPYRSRIQSLLRGRFLRNGRSVEDERSVSVAARELGQLGQRNSVTGLREGFRFRLENTATGQQSSLVENSSSLNMQNMSDQSHLSNSVNLSSDHESLSRNEAIDNHHGIDTLTQLESDRSSDEMDWQESANQTEIWQDDILALGRQEWQQSTEDGLNEWHDGVEEESNGNWLQSSEQDWYHRTPVDEVDHHLPEVDDWHDNDSQVTVDNWIDGLSTLPSPPPPPPPPPPQSQYDNVPNRVSGFIPSDDDNMYSVEIRELLSRRSVSNLLRSGFRESLDRLIRSYVERQVHSPLDWAVQQNSPSPDSIEEELDQQRDNSIEDQHDSVVRPSSIIPSPPVPPRQPLWQSVMHHNNWSRQTIHHTDIEWNVISDLRAELSRLQQGMSNMQRMLEACMDMQLELQRSVRQEVSAALNRSLGKGMCEEWSDDGSKWTNVKNGTCCVCCDGHIDSLLYRCGHMCTCSKCANELVRSGGKCPLCRAPIIEVIRAYSIL